MEREYIGVDLHKEFLQACAVTSSGTRVWEGRFQPMSVVMINEHREGTQGDACWRSAANRGLERTVRTNRSAMPFASGA